MQNIRAPGILDTAFNTIIILLRMSQKCIFPLTAQKEVFIFEAFAMKNSIDSMGANKESLEEYYNDCSLMFSETFFTFAPVIIMLSLDLKYGSGIFHYNTQKKLLYEVSCQKT